MVCLPRSTCGRQRTTWSWFSPSTMLAPGIKRKSSLATSTTFPMSHLTCQCPFMGIYNVKHSYMLGYIQSNSHGPNDCFLEPCLVEERDCGLTNQHLFLGVFLYRTLTLSQLSGLAAGPNLNDPCQIMFVKLTVFLHVCISDLSHVPIVEKTVHPHIYLCKFCETKEIHSDQQERKWKEARQYRK
jgi:hypothetical protein